MHLSESGKEGAITLKVMYLFFAGVRGPPRDNEIHRAPLENHLEVTRSAFLLRLRGVKGKHAFACLRMHLRGFQLYWRCSQMLLGNTKCALIFKWSNFQHQGGCGLTGPYSPKDSKTFQVSERAKGFCNAVRSHTLKPIPGNTHLSSKNLCRWQLHSCSCWIRLVCWQGVSCHRAAEKSVDGAGDGWTSMQIWMLSSIPLGLSLLTLL